MKAEDMHTALIQHRVKGTTASVNCVNGVVIQLDVNKFTNFSSFHNFKYHKNGITVWKAFGIGKGKTFLDSTIYKCHKQATELQSDVGFFEIHAGRQHKSKLTNKVKDSEENAGFYNCTEPLVIMRFRHFKTYTIIWMWVNIAE